MEVYKKVSKSGTVTIPRLLRHELGIHPGTPIVIGTTAGGGITIKKHVPVCRVCGATEKIVRWKSVELCKNCYDLMGMGYEDE
ncbi:MAG: AbrB/MazE/SpoVT family DNA-binding domain-containing protein [Oscillospiraceae bacterium]|nr:AbrB/MazE/SpoVT family DNA-binding domain-containing protein [Oscillospiraceae bacterium]